jgi:hypothetical protein
VNPDISAVIPDIGLDLDADASLAFAIGMNIYINSVIDMTNGISNATGNVTVHSFDVDLVYTCFAMLCCELIAQSNLLSLACHFVGYNQ